MWPQVENDSFDELEPEISWIKESLGNQTGGPRPEAIWRPLRAWRRVLRTMIQAKAGAKHDCVGMTSRVVTTRWCPNQKPNSVSRN